MVLVVVVEMMNIVVAGAVNVVVVVVEDNVDTEAANILDDETVGVDVDVEMILAAPEPTQLVWRYFRTKERRARFFLAVS